MILHLHIRGFVLIDDAELDLGSGLNVITGETGAGKSLIMKALNLLMGARLGESPVRSGSREAVVEGLFDLEQWPDIAEKIAQLTGNESIVQDSQVVLSRTVTDQNRSICRVNGSLVTLTILREATERLIDIHNQHHNQWILLRERHLELLDNFGGQAHRELLDSFCRTFAGVREKSAELLDMEQKLGNKELTLDLLRFQVREIEMARLQGLDETELLSRRRILANQENLLSLCAEASNTLQEMGIIDTIQSLRARTARFADLSKELSEASDLFESASVSLEEAGISLERFAGSLSLDSEEAAEIDATLSTLESLKRKYGPQIPDILNHLEESRKSIDNLENLDGRCEDLRRELGKMEKSLLQDSERLSKSRTELAEQLSKALAQELISLGISAAKVEMKVSQRHREQNSATGHLRPRGGDDLEFLVAFNAGEPLMPIQNVASGGEISRVMLCMKKVFSTFEPRPTMVFDEIDTGIGGKTANMVGKKIQEISAARQVIVITHLPQIASLANSHFLVEKLESQGRTSTRVTRVIDESREKTLAAMMGSEVHTAVAHAREMMERNQG